MKNDPRIEYTPFFNKQRKSVPLEIKEVFRETLALFLDEPNNPTLRNHALKEKFAGYRSIDVTHDYRAVFRETYAGMRKIVTFHMIGTHQELYG